jgi:hypothetical protein
VCTAIFILILLAPLVGDADAHLLPRKKGEPRADVQARNLHHARTAVRFLAAHRPPPQADAPRWARDYRWHRRATAWVLRELVETQVTLELGFYVPGLPPWFQKGIGCIHGHEGAWDDPNAPYYGGLQMDWSFQRSYGPWLLRTKGTADRWTPMEQVRVAWRAFRSGRGWYPWPNTARYCGLI